MPESGIGRRFIPEIGVALQVRHTSVGDSVVFPLSGKDFDESRLVELRESSGDRFVGDRDTSVLEIIRDTLEIVPSTRVLQELKDNIIAASHPLRSMPGHEFIPEEPSKTLFGVSHSVYYTRHSVQSLPQPIIHVGKDLDTVTDTALSGTGHRRIGGRPPWVQHGRRVGRNGDRDMRDDTQRKKRSGEGSATHRILTDSPGCGRQISIPA